MKRFLGRYGWLLLIAFLCLVIVFTMLLPGYSFSRYLALVCIAVVLLFRFLRWLRAKKPKLARVLRTILIIGICLVLALAVFTGIWIASAAKGEADTPCQYVIVLGAGVRGTEPSLILSSRIDSAYTYLTDNPDVICIVSGGKGDGENISEAQCMYEHLVAKGIDPERIWLESSSTSTRENLRYSLALIEEKTGQRPAQAAVLSSEFHLFRANFFAEEQELEMVGVPAKTPWLTLLVNYFLREIVAVWYYMILGG